MSETEIIKRISTADRYDPSRNLKQSEFHRATQTYKLYGGAMGGGKTAAIINEALQLSLDYPRNRGLLLRKTLPSFKLTVLPQIEKFIPPEIIARWNISERKIVLINGSVLIYGGIGDDPEDWQKLMSGEYGWIAVDQAEEMTEREFQMLATRLRLVVPNIKRHFLLTCNPTVGWIKDRFILKNLPDHIFVPALPEDNVANLPPDYIAQMEAILDENLRRAYLRGDWDAIDSPDTLVAYARINDAILRETKRGLPIEIGVDPARHGDDESVIALREGAHVEIFSAERGSETMRTCGLVMKCANSVLARIGIDKISKIVVKVDVIGLGGGIVDRLREIVRALPERLKKKIWIVEINSAAKANNPLKFKNRRAEIHWAIREIIDEISLPHDKELISQLASLRYGIDSAGRIFIVEKEELKKSLGRSPDRAEAVIYSVAHQSAKSSFAFSDSDII